ncbi:MAG: hypothetical protein RLY87_116 [Chloroflexota bacterium]|jgi:hypothetical protein
MRTSAGLLIGDCRSQDQHRDDIALELDSREDVDTMMTKVLANGGNEYAEAHDMGSMYLLSLIDIDSHQWNLYLMDPVYVHDELRIAAYTRTCRRALLAGVYKFVSRLGPCPKLSVLNP